MIEFHDILDIDGNILHYAVIFGDPELVEIILKLIESNVLRVDVNAVNQENNTALHALADIYFRSHCEDDPKGRRQWSWKKDASYQCFKVMFKYAERLGIDINKICEYKFVQF